MSLDVVVLGIELREMSRRFIAVVIGDISAGLVHGVLLVVTIQLLNVQTTASLVVSERSTGAWLQRHIAAGSSLRVQVLS